MARRVVAPKPGTDGTDGEARGASVILNVIEVLRCFTVDQPLQGVTEIAVKVGLHKSSVSRILATLEQAEIVERDNGSRKFRLGLGLISVAGPLLANLDVRRVSLPVMQQLSDSTGETVALVVWSGHEAVTVEQVPGPHQIKHITPLGTRYKAVTNASVQMFLAEMSRDEAVALLRGGSEDRLTDSPIGVDALLERLETCTERGYAVNFGDTSPEEVGIAAPVRDHRGEVVAGVVVAAPAYRVAESAVPDIGAACVRAAEHISARLGATRGVDGRATSPIPKASTSQG